MTSNAPTSHAEYREAFLGNHSETTKNRVAKMPSGGTVTLGDATKLLFDMFPSPVTVEVPDLDEDWQSTPAPDKIVQVLEELFGLPEHNEEDLWNGNWHKNISKATSKTAEWFRNREDFDPEHEKNVIEMNMPGFVLHMEKSSSNEEQFPTASAGLLEGSMMTRGKKFPKDSNGNIITYWDLVKPLMHTFSGSVNLVYPPGQSRTSKQMSQPVSKGRIRHILEDVELDGVLPLPESEAYDLLYGGKAWLNCYREWVDGLEGENRANAPKVAKEILEMKISGVKVHLVEEEPDETDSDEAESDEEEPDEAASHEPETDDPMDEGL